LILELDVAINLVFYTYLMVVHPAKTHCNEPQILTTETPVVNEFNIVYVLSQWYV
jgi:hypothetical protein